MSEGKKPGRNGRSIVSVAALGWLIVFPAPGGSASAGSFKVSPVQINLPADARAVSVKLTNSDAAPVSVRIATFAWSQADGRDVYSPTTDVIASPPIFTIPAGETQLVRIGLRNKGRSNAYRVIFEEIPAQKPVGGQVQITVRLNLPLYVLPPGGGKSDLSWKAWRNSSGAMVVEGRNRGSLHGQVTQLSAQLSGGRQILSNEMGVVLPGSARRWTTEKRANFAVGSPLLLKVRSSAGETQAQIVVEQR